MSKPELNNVAKNPAVSSARLQSTIQWVPGDLNVTDHLLDSPKLSIELAGDRLILQSPTGKIAIVPLTNVKFLVLK